MEEPSLPLKGGAEAGKPSSHLPHTYLLPGVHGDLAQAPPISVPRRTPCLAPKLSWAFGDEEGLKARVRAQMGWVKAGGAGDLTPTSFSPSLP